MSPESTGPVRRALSRPERLLPLACIGAAIVLGASELMTTFKLTAAANQPLCVQSGVDRHHLAQLVLAALGAIGAIVAVLSGSRPAARATAAAGVIALLIFLIIDLPHANNQGSVSSSCDAAANFFTAKAVPQGGFWLELIGALGLAVSGIALATLTPEQLYSMRPRWLVGSGTPPDDTGEGVRPRRRWLRSREEAADGDAPETPERSGRARGPD